MVKYRWYEKLFYKLQLKEQKYFRLVFYLTISLVIIQYALTIPTIRQIFVVAESYEGEPLRFLRNY